MNQQRTTAVNGGTGSQSTPANNVGGGNYTADNNERRVSTS
jgi:hypothetical protein